MATTVKKVCAELKEEKTTERASLGDEATLVANAYRFVSDELNATQLSTLKVVRFLLENPARAGIAFSKPRAYEDAEIREIAERVDDIINRVKKTYAVRHDPSGVPVLTEDASVVVGILERLVEEKRLQVVLFAKTPLVPGAPREFLGARNNIYVNPLSKAKEVGYAIPLDRFLLVFFSNISTTAEQVEENKQLQVENEKLQFEVPVLNDLNDLNRFALEPGQGRPVQSGGSNPPEDYADVKGKASSGLQDVQDRKLVDAKKVETDREVGGKGGGSTKVETEAGGNVERRELDELIRRYKGTKPWYE